jgi:histidinol-phosphate aminotransferase
MSPQPTAIIGALKAYDPGHDLPMLRRRFPGGALTELGSNENSIGPSAKVLEALRAAPVEEVFRYPDPLGLSLRRALAAQLSVAVEQLVLGNGSHELLMLIAQCFAGPGDEVVFSEFGFAVFAIATAAVGATPRRADALPTSHAMPRGHDLDAMAALVGDRTKIVYLANPNNPTGTWFAHDALSRFLERIPPDVLVVVDEAYCEYVAEAGTADALALLPRFPNLLITRTFSKAYGLAGLRIGYAIAHAGVIDALNRLRESFNANALALVAAEAALGDPQHVAQVRAATASEIARVTMRLRAGGLFVHPSQTNFVLIDFREPAMPIEHKLLAGGVVVRPMTGYGLPTCLRVSVATSRENNRFLEALAE